MDALIQIIMNACNGCDLKGDSYGTMPNQAAKRRPYRPSTKAVLLCQCFLLLMTAPSVRAQASFQGLGDLPGGDFGSYANAISADGLVVVGDSRSAAGKQAFRWSSATGIVALDNLLGNDPWSTAAGVTSDGSIVVGFASPAFGVVGAGGGVKWENGTLIPLAGIASAWAASGDGSVIAGGVSGPYAALWRSTGVQQLDPGATMSSVAYASSADGSVAVGTRKTNQGEEAFRWTSSTGMEGLGYLPNGSFISRARAVSADGLVIVGESGTYWGVEAVRWSRSDGMVGLGKLPGSIASQAYAVSADGSVIVGAGDTSTGTVPFIWDQQNGIRNLQSVLQDEMGLNLDGWRLAGATGISADGQSIIGGGIDGDGNYQAWIAHVPEPGTMVFLALGFVGFFWRNPRTCA